MDNFWYCRLTVLGSKARVERFQKSNWNRHLKARHGDLLENSHGRFCCQFEADDPPLESLKVMSRRWPKLTIVFDYEEQAKQVKGLAKAKAGVLDSYRMEY